MPVICPAEKTLQEAAAESGETSVALQPVDGRARPANFRRLLCYRRSFHARTCIFPSALPAPPSTLLENRARGLSRGRVVTGEFSR